MSQKESLHQIFRDLHAERIRTMDPREIADQHRPTEDAGRHGGSFEMGQGRRQSEAFRAAGGRRRARQAERAAGARPSGADSSSASKVAPPVTSLYRITERNLLPGLRELGASLVAISPQVPERLRAIKQRHSLSFSVASDPAISWRASLAFCTRSTSPPRNLRSPAASPSVRSRAPAHGSCRSRPRS